MSDIIKRKMLAKELKKARKNNSTLDEYEMQRKPLKLEEQIYLDEEEYARIVKKVQQSMGVEYYRLAEEVSALRNLLEGYSKTLSDLKSRRITFSEKENK